MDPRLLPLARIAEPHRRRLAFAALVSEEMRRLGASPPIVVGGSALEIFTAGEVRTSDVDLVVADLEAFRSACKGLGLESRGRHFLERTLGLAIEAPGSEPPERILEVMSGEIPVRVTSIEDLLVDRLCAYVHWRSAQDGDWAEMLWKLHGSLLDASYLERRAREEEVAAALGEIRGRGEASA